MACCYNLPLSRLQRSVFSIDVFVRFFNSMFSYLLHPYVLYVIVAIWSQMNDHINMLSAICITSVTVFILMLLRKIKPIYKFLR